MDARRSGANLLACSARTNGMSWRTSCGSQSGPKVIVAYATSGGSTLGIAERIAARLREAGLRVELHGAVAKRLAAG